MLIFGHHQNNKMNLMMTFACCKRGISLWGVLIYVVVHMHEHRFQKYPLNKFELSPRKYPLQGFHTTSCQICPLNLPDFLKTKKKHPFFNLFRPLNTKCTLYTPLPKRHIFVFHTCVQQYEELFVSKRA